jgi:sugar phosphate isomerase/epimerase
MHTNVVTDIRIARETGYDAIELWIPKLLRYLDAGFGTEELKEKLGDLKPSMLNCVLSVEGQDPEFRAGLRKEIKRLAIAASELGCPTIQIIVLNELNGLPWAEMKSRLVTSLVELADISGDFGVRLGLEPVVFSDFKYLTQALEVIESAQRENLGLVVDTWHVWTSQESWEVVENLNPDLIYSAHISDTLPKQGAHWHDDDRTALPGEGILPLEEGIRAIQKTGYNGVWSVEMLSRRHWEWDPFLLSGEIKKRTEEILSRVGPVSAVRSN